MRPALRVRSVPVAPKVLRLALVLGDRIVEEKLVSGGSVTVGQAAKCTFSIPLDGLPRSWTLFEARAGWRLRTAPWMHAQLANVPGDGLLSDKTRGRISIGGDAAILFQFVAPPPVLPKPRLPASLRRRPVDPWLMRIVAVSLVAHLGGFAYFKYLRPIPTASADEPIREVLLTAPVRIRIPVPVPAPAPVPAPGPTPAPAPVAHPTDPAPAPPAPYHFTVAGFQGVVLHSGTFVDVTNDHVSMADLDKGLERVGNHPVAMATTADIGAHDQQPSQLIGDTNRAPVVGPHDPGPTAMPPSDEPVPIVNPLPIDPIDPAPGFDPTSIQEKIARSYKSQVIDCYRRELKETPELSGTLSLTFTVGIAGNVTSASAGGLTTHVDYCVEQSAKTRWRFTAPPDATTVEINFVMRPGH